MNRVSLWLRTVVVAACLLVSLPAFAWKFELGENTNLNIDYLLQVQAQFAEKAAPNKTDWSKDFFVRRSRILLFGDLWKGISFFMETEQANWGKGGDWTGQFFVQDAFLTLKAHDAFMVDIGMILLPFSRANTQGAVGLNGLDYHTGVIKFHDGSQKVWRDIGIQLRGYAHEKKFQYRLGVFNGAQNIVLQKDAKAVAVVDAAGKNALASNPEDWPRFTGMVRYAILGKEPDFFSKGIYFGTEALLSLGVGFDFQMDAAMDRPAVLDGAKKVTSAGTLTHTAAVSADVFLDVPFGADKQHEVVFQGGFFWYDQGKDLKWAKDGTSSVVAAKNSGLGVMGELGYRWTFFEPLLAVDWFQGKAKDNDFLSVKGGLNFWIRKHGASIKTEFGATKTGKLSSADWMKTFTTQAQLFF
jgi:hypothetical protein